MITMLWKMAHRLGLSNIHATPDGVAGETSGHKIMITAKRKPMQTYRVTMEALIFAEDPHDAHVRADTLQEEIAEATAMKWRVRDVDYEGDDRDD